MVPMSAMKSYVVNDVVKLSMHMDGFVQFSKVGTQPIVSGYNSTIGQIRGAGVRAPEPVNISSGPLFGMIFQGLSHYALAGKKPIELFEENDLWRHPEFSPPDDTAFNLEAFMLPGDLREAARFVAGKRLLERRLPFYSRFEFSHDLGIIEIPHLNFILGLTLSPIRPDQSRNSGYRLGGPGCHGSDGWKGLMAWYPRPDFVNDSGAVSLDYRSPEVSE